MKIDNIIFKASVEIGEKRAEVIEELIELHLQPKPKGMPAFMWRWLIHRLLVIKGERPRCSIDFRDGSKEE